MADSFDIEFYHALAAIGESTPRPKWYLTAIVALAALNYPNEIPKLYQLLLDAYIPEADRFTESTKIREGLTKVCGIMGAAKAGSALRALASATPPELADRTYHREGDTLEKARRRGAAFYSRIYDNIPGYDSSKTLHASPDYYHIVTELFYGQIFSFDGILDDLETGQVIVAALLGIDCHEQARNHILGMMMCGASHDDLGSIRSIVLALAQHHGVKLKNTPFLIPTVEPQNQS